MLRFDCGNRTLAKSFRKEDESRAALLPGKFGRYDQACNSCDKPEQRGKITSTLSKWSASLLYDNGPQSVRYRPWHRFPLERQGKC